MFVSFIIVNFPQNSLTCGQISPLSSSGHSAGRNVLRIRPVYSRYFLTCCNQREINVLLFHNLNQIKKTNFQQFQTRFIVESQHSKVVLSSDQFANFLGNAKEVFPQPKTMPILIEVLDNFLLSNQVIMCCYNLF